MLSQVERNLEQEDVQACANSDGALIRVTRAEYHVNGKKIDNRELEYQ